MVKKHLKQLAAPKSWPLERKSSVFVTRPSPGAHTFETGIPLSLALTNLVGVAKTTAEAKSILYKREVLVDQRRRKSPDYLVGFMDTISFPELKEDYRVMMNNKGVLVCHKIDGKEAKNKIARVVGKKVLGKDKVQLNLAFGRNVIVKKDDVKVGDSLMLELPEQKIAKHLALEPKCTVLLTSKKHMGTTGHVEEIRDDKILIKSGEETFLTDKATTIVIGKTKPEISLPE